jgi:aconitate hydratase 2/2-methylisocitrate dehydratase
MVKLIEDDNGEPVLEQVYSVDTGTVLTINTKKKKLYNGDQELIDILSFINSTKNGVYKSRWIIRSGFWKKTSNICSVMP